MKYIIEKISILIISGLILLPYPLFCQNGKITLDDKIKMETIKKISSLLKDNYVFPDVAKSMNDYLSSQLTGGAYQNITEPMKFADKLTEDLQSISKDKHLRVRFSPQDAKDMLAANNSEEEDERKWNEEMAKQNYGFKKVEVLPGNIGYIDFRNFASPKYSKETITAVMKFVENCDALIFDLRQNGGGDPAGVQLICSYLFGEEPVHLNDLYFRPKDKTEEFWTLRKVDGKKMPDVPVYVLTSNYTFSGAEEFAYNLKNLKRATIIGEQTGGGANPGGPMAANEYFLVFVPTGKAINPITKTNWEGTGVTPDVQVSSVKALEKARIMAMENLAPNIQNQQMKNTFNWMIESLKASMDAPVIDDNILKSYAGSYGDRTVTYENGKLWYQRKGRPKMQMTAMTEDTFMFNEVEYFRLRFVKDASGIVTEVNGLYDNGDVDKSLRTN